MQNIETGQLRGDAKRQLTTGHGIVHAREADDIHHQALRLTQRAGMIEPVSWLDEVRLELLLNPDPIIGLNMLISRVRNLRLFKISPEPFIVGRNGLWKVLTESATSGVSWREMRERGWASDQRRVTDNIGILPAQYIAAPLVARNNPMAMVFTTYRGAQVVAVPTVGLFVRPTYLGGWPSGAASPIPYGTEDVKHRPSVIFDELPPTTSLDALEVVANGTNQLLGLITDPFNWQDKRGELDIVMAATAWTTVDLGLAAVAKVGEDWGAEESFWTALRALGALQSLWPPRQLESVLHPSTIRKTVLPTFPAGFLRDWSTVILNEYEQALGTAGDSVAAAVANIVDIRNLVHGARPTRGKSLDLRIRALESSQTPVLSAIRDIAAMWWTAVLLNPRAFLEGPHHRNQIAK